MLPLNKMILNDTQLYASVKPDERHQVNEVREHIKNIRQQLLINMNLLVNSN